MTRDTGGFNFFSGYRVVDVDQIKELTQAHLTVEPFAGMVGYFRKRQTAIRIGV